MPGKREKAVLCLCLSRVKRWNLEAKKEGYQEALMLDYRGIVGEGPGENIFYAKDNKIFTPKLGNVLPGITRKSIIQIIKDGGYEVIEKDITPDELKNSDESWFTGTAAEVTPIASIDDKPIGKKAPGPITEKLKKIFLDSVHGKNKKYESWLTYVDK